MLSTTLRTSLFATTLYAGTGKTLSLICSVLQWLENTQSQENQLPDAESDGDQICADLKYWAALYSCNTA